MVGESDLGLSEDLRTADENPKTCGNGFPTQTVMRRFSTYFILQSCLNLNR